MESEEIKQKSSKRNQYLEEPNDPMKSRLENQTVQIEQNEKETLAEFRKNFDLGQNSEWDEEWSTL